MADILAKLYVKLLLGEITPEEYDMARWSIAKAEGSAK